MIALVTDSNAMLPVAITGRFGIRVVPLTVVVDGEAAAEDAHLDRAAFFARLRSGAAITTAAPSPGEVLDSYRAAIEAGAAEILSIHVGASYSATLASARLAASMVDVAVHVVDTGQASFAHGLCVVAAAEALQNGADAPGAANVARMTGAATASVFTVAEIGRARAGGRIPVDAHEGVPVVALNGTDLSEVGRVTSVDQAVTSMTAVIAAVVAGRLRVGVGDADDPGAGSALAAAVGALPNVDEVIRYQIGPSVAAHTGAGSFGAVFHPFADLAPSGRSPMP